MPRATLLIVDNSLDSIGTGAELLEENGYQTLVAFHPVQAKQIISKHRIDLVILEIRLINKNDPYDISGFTVAREIDSSIPKIIFTSFPSIEAVRMSLATVDGPPLASDFLAKDEGLENLLAVIQHVLCPV